MTYSIVARDPETGQLGVAVASRFFAVGALVPHIDGKVAVATQAFANPLWGVRGVAAMAASASDAAAIAGFVARDANQSQRQAHMIDLEGRSAAHTGSDCVDWAGHRIAEGKPAEPRLAVEEFGAVGMQVCANVNDTPLGQKDCESLFACMAEAGQPDLMYPARGESFPYDTTESRAECEILWTSGWP